MQEMWNEYVDLYDKNSKLNKEDVLLEGEVEQDALGP